MASISLNDFHNVLLVKKVQDVIQELEVIRSSYLFTFLIADYNFLILLLYTLPFCLSAAEFIHMSTLLNGNIILIDFILHLNKDAGFCLAKSSAVQL